VQAHANYEREGPARSETQTATWMLIVGIDYDSTDRPLNSSIDANNIKNFAESCGVQHCLHLSNEKCTREAILESVQEAAQQCGPDDYFIFYYAGYGAHVELANGNAHYWDERDHRMLPGRDEAFVCVNTDGQYSEDTMMIASDLAHTVTSSFHPKTRIILLSDGCHSGTIWTLSKEEWIGREVVAISGFQDHDGPGNPGQGGLFTHALLLAADKLSQLSCVDCSVGLLYNAILTENTNVFRNTQDIVLECVPGFSSDRMAWPLLPNSKYQAPLNVCAGLTSKPKTNGNSGASFSVWETNDVEVMNTLGVTSGVVSCASRRALLKPVDIEEYLQDVFCGDSPDGHFIDNLQERALQACTISQCIVQ